MRNVYVLAICGQEQYVVRSLMCVCASACICILCLSVCVCLSSSVYAILSYLKEDLEDNNDGAGNESIESIQAGIWTEPLLCRTIGPGGFGIYRPAAGLGPGR
jgi:hypothetical protein